MIYEGMTERWFSLCITDIQRIGKLLRLIVNLPLVSLGLYIVHHSVRYKIIRLICKLHGDQLGI